MLDNLQILLFACGASAPQLTSHLRRRVPQHRLKRRLERAEGAGRTSIRDEDSGGTCCAGTGPASVPCCAVSSGSVSAGCPPNPPRERLALSRRSAPRERAGGATGSGQASFPSAP